MKKFKVLVTERLHPKAMELLAEQAEVFISPSVEKEDLVKAVRGMDGMVIRSSKLFNEVIDAGKDLKVVGRHGIGTDNIDISYLTSKGIPLVNAPTGNVRSVAERVITYMLALSSNLLKNDRHLRNGVFSQPGKSLCGMVTDGHYEGVEISRKTMGVIGFGNIGRMVSEMASKGFGVNILVYDPYIYGKVELPEYAEWAETLDEICEKSDYISLHVPKTPQTTNMFSVGEFKKMKNSAYIINCGRGGLVDEVALYDAVKNGEIAGAGIDVYALEPPVKDLPLFELENVIFSPHSAGLSEEAAIGLGIESCQGVLDVLNGNETPRNLVNKDYFKNKK